ncbi:MAG: xanthine dehydrogenase family protein [Chloroflexi bacterium]|nr:xanthine dehydrogenase family protein [Ardenticatenaceae bacterium]MBL1127445.1 xanthine dehydrogenase family protein molybdopterin-binding subunit [Chloroflexota bacterium]NOG33508.1 xanthine dehydrogenase family protein [Chloroflexota bacterium]GIK55797.1 MAG: xanthine dehydrogenase [Chloroflexota bacterium]
MSEYKAIGTPTPVLDGRDKITGQVQYATDIKIPGMLHGRLVTSPHAHATITSINAAAALALPGVVRVLTAADLPDIPPKSRNKLFLARGRVIFAGQPVALVLAETAAAAQDGAEQVWVEYEPQPAVITIAEALAPGAPLVWPGGKPGASGEAGAHGADVGDDDEEGEDRVSGPNIANGFVMKRGDIAAGFAEADVIVERTFTTSMVHQSYLEPMTHVAVPDAYGEGITIYASTQAPFYAREQVADVLGVPETAVRIIPTLPGGAFGGKFFLYESFVALAARAVGRPVSLSLTRSEEMLATNPAPAAEMHVKLGAKRDGTFVALQGDIKVDTGCFPSYHGVAGWLLGSYYQTPNLESRYTEVFTHKVSPAAYRAPGAPQATFALESVVDEMAQQLGIGPVELRLKNASKPGDPLADGKLWPVMGMTEVLQAAQSHPLYQHRAEAQAKGRGVGVAIGGWPGGTEPTSAQAQLHRDGTLHVHIGSVDLTGTPAGFTLIAAETFGVSPDKVRIVYGDTSNMPYAGATGGSKITYMVGPSIIKACEDARQQVLAIAAEEMEADPADMEIVDGRVQVKGVPDKALGLGELAKKTMDFGAKYAPVVGNGRHANTEGAPGFCAQIAEVEVDRETGEVTVHRLVAIQDVGQVINPLTLEGQMQGGVMQGLGWALYEGMAFDEYGTPLTGSWVDYTVPHFTHAVPDFEMVFVEVPAPHGPFGAKGAGEPPIIATAAAVANAIAAATDGRVTQLPMTAPRVLAALMG